MQWWQLGISQTTNEPFNWKWEENVDNDFWVEIIAKQQVHVKLKYLIG